MARLHSCNILQAGVSTRQLWQFDGSKFSLNREQKVPGGQPFPAGLVGKSWSSLWQTRLNIAWLPTEEVFLRAVTLPKADLAETRSMVELQLEKLSPLPVTQIVWGVHVLPSQTEAKPVEPVSAEAAKPEALQSVVVIIVERGAVEDFLGRLEQDGFLADGLEVPLLDQLRSSPSDADGAWVYLGNSATGRALVAWWQQGRLLNLGLIRLPADNTQTDVIRDQLAQISWAGELEGWLTSPPKWHLAAGNTAANEWSPAFAKVCDGSFEVVEPPASVALAAATARRAAQPDNAANLLPAEYSTRYRQQFVDRLWLRGLMAVGLLYVAAVAIYFIALQVVVFQTRKVENQVAELGGAYTNAIQVRARYQIMKERQDLKFAALDCWKTTAELLPPGVTLDSLDFQNGSRLTLRGSAPADTAVQLSDFNAAMKKATVGDQLLFSRVDGLTYNQAGNNMINWNFTCELNRTEARE